jgi:hypothetical protein
MSIEPKNRSVFVGSCRIGNNVFCVQYLATMDVTQENILALFIAVVIR